LRTFGDHPDGYVLGVAFSPDGTHLAADGEENGFLIVWHVGSGQEIYARSWPFDLTGLSYSPDGKYLALADINHCVHILDATSGKDVARVDDHIGGVNGLAYRPGGKCLAARCDDQTALVWDINSRKLQTLKRHEANVLSVAYRPDGRWLTSADSDGWVIQ
jgi:WD40 repeat protein